MPGKSLREPVFGGSSGSIDRHPLALQIGDAGQFIGSAGTDHEWASERWAFAVHRGHNRKFHAASSCIKQSRSSPANGNIEIARRQLHDGVAPALKRGQFNLQAFCGEVAPLLGDKERGINHHGHIA